MKLRSKLIGSAVGILCCLPALGQATDAVTVRGLDNQIYVGFEHTRFDYELLTPQGNKVLGTSGVGVQFNYRNFDHLMVSGLFRYGSGSVESEALTTVAAGGGLVQPIWRLEPYIQALAGMSRLSSTGNIYLSSNSASSFTYLFQAGVDLTLGGRWGIRPIFVEVQHLSYGPNGSQYRSAGAGVLYRFGSSYYGRHRNGR